MEEKRRIEQDRLGLFLVIFCSAVLTGIVLTLFLVGDDAWGGGKIVGTAVGTVWAFFVVPAVVWTFRRAVTGRQPIDSAAILVAILIAPVLGVLYYVDYFRRG